MSETALPRQTTFATKQPKTPFRETPLAKGFYEFLTQLWQGASIHTNKVTTLNAVAVTGLILAVSYFISSYFNYTVLDLSVSHLSTALYVMSLATYFYVGTYLFPIVKHVMKYYQKKRNKRLKAEYKARVKAHKAAVKQEKIAQRVANGDYII